MIILSIAGSACLAVLFVAVGGAVRLKRILRWPQDRRLKPFDCELCLAWWLGVVGGLPHGLVSCGLIPYELQDGHMYIWVGPVWASINFETLTPFFLYTGGCAAILAVLIKKLLR